MAPIGNVSRDCRTARDCCLRHLEQASYGYPMANDILTEQLTSLQARLSSLRGSL